MLDQLKKFLRDNPKVGLVAVLAVALPVLVFISQQITRYRSRAAGEIATICLNLYPCTTAPTYSITATETLVPVSVYTSTGNITGTDLEVVFNPAQVRLSRDVILNPNPDPQTGANRLQTFIITPFSQANSTGRIRISVGQTPNTSYITSPYKIVDLPFVSASSTSSTATLVVNPIEVVGFVGTTNTLYTPSVTNPAANLTVNTTTTIIPTTGTSPATGYILLDPQSATKNVGDIFPVEIEFRTGNNSSTAQGITGISLRLTFPYPGLDVVTPAGARMSQIFPNYNLSGWTPQINSVTRTSNQVTIDFSALYTVADFTGFSTFTNTTLATIYFIVNAIPSPNPIPVAWNLTETRMLPKNEPIVNILNTPINGLYTIASTITPTVTPPPPTSTPIPSGTPPPPTPTTTVPTPTPSAVTLTFGFRMQAITFPNVSRNSTLSLTGTEFSVPVISNTLGIFFPPTPVNLTGIITGIPYTAYEKAPGYLQKLLGGITLFPGANTGPTAWHSKVLRAGDFNSSNSLNINDIGLILSVYTQLSVPVTTSNSQYDIDANNLINIVDIAHVLNNYTCITVYGDPIPALPVGTCAQRP